MKTKLQYISHTCKDLTNFFRTCKCEGKLMFFTKARESDALRSCEDVFLNNVLLLLVLSDNCGDIYFN